LIPGEINQEGKLLVRIQDMLLKTLPEWIGSCYIYVRNSSARRSWCGCLRWVFSGYKDTVCLFA
jgi:hypothetical protein